MEYFIEQLPIALPVLVVNVLRVAAAEPPAPTTPRDDVRSPIFELAIPKRGIRARAQQIDGEFTVLAGSGGRIGEREREVLPDDGCRVRGLPVDA